MLVTPLVAFLAVLLTLLSSTLTPDGVGVAVTAEAAVANMMTVDASTYLVIAVAAVVVIRMSTLPHAAVMHAVAVLLALLPAVLPPALPPVLAERAMLLVVELAAWLSVLRTALLRVLLPMLLSVALASPLVGLLAVLLSMLVF